MSQNTTAMQCGAGGETTGATDMTTQQPDALRLANVCSNLTRYSMDAHLIAAELRTQHARITELESQLAQRFDAADMATAAAQGFRDDATAPAQPVAAPATQQGAAYAALPDLIHVDGEIWSAILDWKDAKRGKDALRKASDLERVLSDQMHAFADATHTLRASHGQALRLLTQKEKDSLGRRAEGMDGNEWDQWVQEKFAQVNGLKVQGGSYERDWE